MIDRSAFQNEVHSVAAAPWSHAHPRNDHQLVFPLSGDRLLFVWCAYYVRRPSVINQTVFEEGATVQDEAPVPDLGARLRRSGAHLERRDHPAGKPRGG